MSIMSIIIIYIVVFFLIIGVGFVNSIFSYIRRLLYIKNFKEYISVLEYHMDKAYDMVHKDKILAFSLDAYRVSDDDYESISQEFVKLVKKYIGPTLLKEFIHLYGDIDSFIFILLAYFSDRYENDEIRKTSLNNLTQEE